MNKELFRSKFDETCEAATKTFLEVGSHAQIIILGWEKEADEDNVEVVVGFQEYNDQTSDNLPEIIKGSISEIRKEVGVSGMPDYFFQIAEGWISSNPIEDLEIPDEGMPSWEDVGGIRPRDDPDRGEGLFVVAGHKNGSNFMWMSEIRRKPALHLSEPVITGDTEGDHRSRIRDIIWGNEGGEEKKDLEAFAKELGDDLDKPKMLVLASGWISATVESPLGNNLPKNIRDSLLRGAKLISKLAREMRDDG